MNISAERLGRRKVLLRRRDDGAAAVEFALIAPLLIILTFGIIEFALLLRDHVATTSIVRAGARAASALPRNDAMRDEAVLAMERAGSALPKDSYEELWVYKAQKSGANVGHPLGDTDFTSCATDCYVYRWNDTRDEFRLVAADSWPSTSINACAGDPDADSVGIYLRASHNWLTGIFNDVTDVADHAVFKFEPIATYSDSTACKP